MDENNYNNNKMKQKSLEATASLLRNHKTCIEFGNSAITKMYVCEIYAHENKTLTYKKITGYNDLAA